MRFPYPGREPKFDEPGVARDIWMEHYGMKRPPGCGCTPAVGTALALVAGVLFGALLIVW
ncbi:MAG: hypothetical protein U0547_00990 [Dehalococcoidia bacterium]